MVRNLFHQFLRPSSSVVMKHLMSIVLGAFMIKVGIEHFIRPAWFEPIVPRILGYPKFWVHATGVIEIVCGGALIITRTRRKAGLGLAAFLVIVYWANLNMWANDIKIGKTKFSTIEHVGRGFVQLIMIGISLWVGGWFIGKKKKVCSLLALDKE